MVIDAPSFWSDQPPPEDWLGRQMLVQTTAALLGECRTPLVLGVYGSWGAGKTTFLHHLKSALDAQGTHLVRTVWFDAWEHQFDESPVVGLLHCIRRAAGLNERDVLTLVADISSALLGELRVPYTSLSIRTLKEWREAANRARFEEQEARARLRETFGELIAKTLPRATADSSDADAPTGDPGRLVVFIDDLDRCEPKVAVRVLEAMKLYFDHAGTVFVLAMDRPIVESAIKMARDGVEGESQYLDKIVQIPFNLPPLGPDVLDAYVERLLPEELRETKPILAAAGADNPRVAKRLVNGLILGDRLLRTSNSANYDTRLLAAVQVIQQIADPLYRELRRNPELLIHLLRLHHTETSGRPLPDATPEGPQEGPEELAASLWSAHVGPNPELRQALQQTPAPSAKHDARQYFIAARTSADADATPQPVADPFLKHVATSDRPRARLSSTARKTDRMTSGGHRYYEWTVYVDAPSSFLEGIQQVEYLLHESFSPRQRVANDPADGFAITSTAWGNHSLAATVRYRDGHEDAIRYYVNLEDSG